MDGTLSMTPLDLELPEPPEPWWTVTVTVRDDGGGRPLVEPGLRVPAELELELLSQSVLSVRVPGRDEVDAIVAASQVVRVLLGRWPGLASASVQQAPVTA